MSEIVFDTSILVDHLRGLKDALPLVDKVREGIIIGYISTLTVVELFSGKDTENTIRRKLVEDLLELFNKIEMSEQIAETAGEFRRKYQIGLGDAVIAATTAAMRCKLLTKDLNDFKIVKEITVEEPY